MHVQYLGIHASVEKEVQKLCYQLDLLIVFLVIHAFHIPSCTSHLMT